MLFVTINIKFSDYYTFNVSQYQQVTTAIYNFNPLRTARHRIKAK